MEEEIPDYCAKTNLVLGCGNIFFGDDAFGPAVADHLVKNYKIPDDTEVLNVETSSKPILFDIALSEKRPKRLIIVDAFELGKAPGEVAEVSVKDIPKKKIDDFSLHQMPTSNLLRELEDRCGVEVSVVVCQTKRIPEEIDPGLSAEVKAAVPRACGLIFDMIGAKAKTKNGRFL